MDLALTLRTLRRRWWVVALAVLVAVGAAVATTPSNPTTASITSYTATHTLLQAADVSTTINYPRLKLFATTGEIPIQAAKELKYPGEPAVLASRVIVVNDPQTQTLRVTVNGDDGPEDARIANAFAEQITAFLVANAETDRNAAIANAQAQVDAIAAQVRALPATSGDPLVNAQRQAQVSRYQAAFQRLQDLQAQPQARSPLVTLQAAVPVPVVSSGFTPPSSTKGRVLVGLCLGLLVGAGIVLGMDRLDTRLRTRETVEETTRLPVLTEVPLLPRSKRRRRSVEVYEHAESAEAEAYRTLRASVQLMPSGLPGDGSTLLERARGGPQVVMVTSANAGEGKTTTVVNLAAALAEAGHQVLVLDCDFRRPTVGQHFGLAPADGLSDLITGATAASLEELAEPSGVPGVRVVQSGRATAQPGSLTARLGPVVRQARDIAGFVVIDTAPLLTVSEAADLAPWVDTTLLTMRSGRTGREAAQRAVEQLERLGAAVAGIALIGTRTAGSGYGSYGGYGRTDAALPTLGTSKRRHARRQDTSS